MPLEPQDVSDLIRRTIAMPVKSSSLYYSLYFLDEIMGVDEAAFDLSQMEDELYDGFFWYGIHTISREYSNASRRFIVKGQLWEDIEIRRRNDFILERLDEDLKDMSPFLADFSHPSFNVLTGFEGLDENFNVLSEPYRYIKAVRELLSIKTSNKLMDIARSDRETTWTKGFGGSSWVSICDHLLNRRREMKRIWVDQSWAIEHNTAGWIDKVRLETEELINIYENMDEQELLNMLILNDNRVSRAERKLENGKYESRKAAMVDNMNHKNVRENLVGKILDMNFDAVEPSDMSEIFRFSSWYNREVGPDLGFWRRNLL